MSSKILLYHGMSSGCDTKHPSCNKLRLDPFFLCSKNRMCYKDIKPCDAVRKRSKSFHCVNNFFFCNHELRLFFCLQLKLCCKDFMLKLLEIWSDITLSGLQCLTTDEVILCISL